MPATAIPVTTAKEVFLVLLSHVRYYHERSSHIYQELGKAVNDPQVKEALEARAFITEKVLATVDQCFKVIGEKPVEFSGRLQEVFIDDFRKELAEIESPVAKKIFVLAKLVHITHARIGELAALTAAADVAGHYGVGLMLETCLADKMVFAERTRQLIRHAVEKRISERVVA